MAHSTYDLVVVGAGMTGTGVALDAASRGLRVALIDAGDVASGTSSKSSKMVHGGLRYLQQREFRLVYENLRERQRLLENAPFLVRPLPFLVPLFGNNGVASKALVKGYSTALRLYELSGAWRIGRRHRKITRDETLAHLPTLNAERLVAGFLYFDARGDDARVALTLARTAALDFDADVATYVRCVDILHDDTGRVHEVVALDVLTHTTFSISTAAVVNATGVWADESSPSPSTRRRTASPRPRACTSASRATTAGRRCCGPERSRRSAQHLRGPLRGGALHLHRHHGHRLPRFIRRTPLHPRGRRVPVARRQRVDVLKSHPRRRHGTLGRTRPLLAPVDGRALKERTADLSRRHQVTDSRDGVMHITGGKWTTYRQMAEDTVDARSVRASARPCARIAAPPRRRAWRPSTAGQDAPLRTLRRGGTRDPRHDRVGRSTGRTTARRTTLRRRPNSSSPRDSRWRRHCSTLDPAHRAHCTTPVRPCAVPRASRRSSPGEMSWSDEDVRRELDAYESLVRREFSGRRTHFVECNGDPTDDAEWFRRRRSRTSTSLDHAGPARGPREHRHRLRPRRGGRADHGRDWWPLSIPDVAAGRVPRWPGVVVRATSSDDVSNVMRVAAKHRVAVTPQGGRSGVVGGAVAPEGAIALDLTGLNRVLDVDSLSGTVSVEAGVFGPDLERAVAADGLDRRITSRSPSRSPPSVDGSPVAGRVSTRIVTARSRTSCAASASCSRAASGSTRRAPRAGRSAPTSCNSSWGPKARSG